MARMTKAWANPHEIALARHFVERLDALPAAEMGRFHIGFVGNPDLAAELSKLLRDARILGLKVESDVPSRPDGPAIACSVDLAGLTGREEARVTIKSSNGSGQWTEAGTFTVPLATKDGKRDVVGFADSVAAGVLAKMVDAKLVKGKKVKGKETYTIRIDNYSPLILNGLAVAGATEEGDSRPRMVSGLCLSPRRSLSLPATHEVVEKFGLKHGVRVVAIDLSGL